jgi:hypothetical protein
MILQLQTMLEPLILVEAGIKATGMKPGIPSNTPDSKPVPDLEQRAGVSMKGPTNDWFGTVTGL